MKNFLEKQYGIYFLKNLSIRQKMIGALVSCVIIPIVILGIVSTTRIMKLSEQNQYEMQAKQLMKHSQDIEKIYEMIKQESAALTRDSAIQAIVAGNATVMDYKNAAQKMVQASQTIDFCSTIALSKNGQVLFQRGSLYMNESENTVFTNQIEKENTPYLWIPENQITFQKGIHIAEKIHISYYTSIMNEVTLKNGGALSTHINEEDFFERFTPFSDYSRFSETFLTDKEGTVFMENKTNHDLNKLCWSKFKEQKLVGEGGYFSLKEGNEEYIVLYTKCGISDWYLFQIEEKSTLYSAQIVFVVFVVFSCILFGIVYGIIQNHTIIKPLHHLSKRIDVVKMGVLEKNNYEMAHDEIGNVEKGFEEMVEHIKDLINQVYVQTIKTQDAERETLLAQMNPHFLYNSLDAIHWLAIRNKDYEVSEQLEALAEVYRHILKFGEGVITIGEDLELIDSYLMLLEFQMGDRVTFIKEIPQNLNHYMIPKLMLQPLIENAVQHGMKDVSALGKIKIKMRKREEYLSITVSDNGAGCDVSKIKRLIKERNSREAFALRNIDERLCLRYGAEYGLKIYSKAGRGTIVKIVIKLEEKSDELNDC